ncbi:MAG: hypothetical protein GY927_02775 [bacterium]|nr:hypothetical protein [bacterium]
MKKTFIILMTLGTVSLTALSPAAAGNGSFGYDPLYWNGPEGSIDYNILFEGSPRPGYLTRLLSRRHKVSRACTEYSRKYLRTGRRSWLRKYEACLDRHN